MAPPRAKALNERPSSRCQGGRRDVFVLFFLCLLLTSFLSSDAECLTPPLFLRLSSDTRLIASFRSTLLSMFACANQLTAVPADSANQHRTSSTCQPACRGRKCRKIMFATNMCLIMNAGLQPDRIELSVSAGPESITHWSDRSVQVMSSC